MSKYLETAGSRRFIMPLCRLLGGVELKQFKPASERQWYKSFQDFYTRKRATDLPIGTSKIAWPCDGLLAAVIETEGESSPSILVKGHLLKANAIFGAEIDATTPWIVNIYLGVMDYHRVHSPVNGIVIKIDRFHGRLETVNPIFYREPFQPSFVNERVVLTIRTDDGALMHMAIVGAAFAGSIILNDLVLPGARLKSNQEIGYFKLGSQVCMTTPTPPDKIIGDTVAVGSALNGSS
ncbi:MAG: phosphatidylserine decarboxylase [Blastocatellia bacterium]|nr:phosphatidylserine decarboxylase [Blastocatellia bacterium]